MLIRVMPERIIDPCRVIEIEQADTTVVMYLAGRSIPLRVPGDAVDMATVIQLAREIA